MQTSRAMATALNVVQTPHSYGDLMLLTKAAQENKECTFFFFLVLHSISIFCPTIHILSLLFPLNPFQLIFSANY